MVVSLTIDSAELPLVLFCIHNAFKLEFYIICSQINLQVLFYPVLKHSKATFLPWGGGSLGAGEIVLHSCSVLPTHSPTNFVSFGKLVELICTYDEGLYVIKPSNHSSYKTTLTFH